MEIRVLGGWKIKKSAGGWIVMERRPPTHWIIHSAYETAAGALGKLFERRAFVKALEANEAAYAEYLALLDELRPAAPSPPYPPPPTLQEQADHAKGTTT